MHTTSSKSCAASDPHHARLVTKVKRVFGRIERIHAERTNIIKRIHDDIRVISKREVEYMQKLALEEDDEEHKVYTRHSRSPSPPTDGMSVSTPPAAVDLDRW
jgi:hypothetical protein